MINLIKPVKFQISITWDHNRTVLVDIECNIEGDNPIIYAKPENLLEKRLPVQRPWLVPSGPDAVDHIRLIAYDIVEYATTGRLDRTGTGKLTHGPFVRFNQISQLSSLLGALFLQQPLMVKGDGAKA